MALDSPDTNPQTSIPKEIKLEDERRLVELSSKVQRLGMTVWEQNKDNPEVVTAIKDKDRRWTGSLALIETDLIKVIVYHLDQDNNPYLEIVNVHGLSGQGRGNISFFIHPDGTPPALILGVSTDDAQRKRIDTIKQKDPFYEPIAWGPSTDYNFRPDGTIQKIVLLPANSGLGNDPQSSQIESAQEYTVIGLALQSLRDNLKSVIKSDHIPNPQAEHS